MCGLLALNIAVIYTVGCAPKNMEKLAGNVQPDQMAYLNANQSEAKEESGSYDRDTSPGKVVEITLSEMERMLAEKQSFAVAFMKTDCSYCHDFSSMLKEYQKNHNMTMYEVILDQEPLSPEENREIIVKYFPVFDKTPGLFYAMDGEMASFIPTTKEDMTPENFEAWVKKFRMDQVK